MISKFSTFTLTGKNLLAFEAGRSEHFNLSPDFGISFFHPLQCIKSATSASLQLQVSSSLIFRPSSQSACVVNSVNEQEDTVQVPELILKAASQSGWVSIATFEQVLKPTFQTSNSYDGTLAPASQSALFGNPVIEQVDKPVSQVPRVFWKVASHANCVN